MREWMAAAVWIGVVLTAPAARGQTVRPLSLEQALAIAEPTSEAVAISRAAVTRAEGQRLQLRSGLLPQVSANLSYVRTLKSQFQDLARIPADTTAPTSGGAAPTGSSSPIDSIVNRLPFGQPNQYTLAFWFAHPGHGSTPHADDGPAHDRPLHKPA